MGTSTSVLWCVSSGVGSIQREKSCGRKTSLCSGPSTVSGFYNGRPAQPPRLWHPEVNGALISPSGSVGQPGNVADDVLVDGKIITGEDDPWPREMSRKIPKALR